MIHTLQVTIGSGVTQVSATSVSVKQVTFQNNGASNICRVGGLGVTTSIGQLLSKSAGTGLAGGSATFGSGDNFCADLREFYLAGTQSDVIDVTYIA